MGTTDGAVDGFLARPDLAQVDLAQGTSRKWTSRNRTSRRSTCATRARRFGLLVTYGVGMVLNTTAIPRSQRRRQGGRRRREPLQPTCRSCSTKGGGTFAPAVNYTASAYSVAVADVNGDGKPDVLSNGLDVLQGNGDGTFKPFVAFADGGFDYRSRPRRLRPNGTTDVALVDPVDDRLVIMLGNANGTFRARSTTHWPRSRTRTAS